MPTPIASPDSEIMLSVTPEKYMSTTAKITLIGMLTAVMIVGLISLRKKSSISIASTAPMSRFWRTELMTRWIYSP